MNHVARQAARLAINESINAVNLSPVKSIKVKFDPFHERALSARSVTHMLKFIIIGWLSIVLQRVHRQN